MENSLEIGTEEDFEGLSGNLGWRDEVQENPHKDGTVRTCIEGKLGNSWLLVNVDPEEQ